MAIFGNHFVELGYTMFASLVCIHLNDNWPFKLTSARCCRDNNLATLVQVNQTSHSVHLVCLKSHVLRILVGLLVYTSGNVIHAEFDSRFATYSISSVDGVVLPLSTCLVSWRRR